MDPREAGIRYWLMPIPPEQMPGLASQWAAAGFGGDAIVASAASDLMGLDSRDVRDLFIEALKEVDAWHPSKDHAMLAVVEDVAYAISQDEAKLGEQAQALRQLLDFDDIAFGSLSGPHSDVAVMCYVHGSDAFEEQGGIERLRRGVRAVVSSPS